MNVADHLGSSGLPADVAVIIALLPELFALASQFARGGLLEDFEKLGNEDRWWLVHEQMDVFGHQNVCVDPCLMPGPRPFQHGLDRLPRSERFKQRQTVKATEGDEVKSFRLLKPFQATRHGSILSGHHANPTPAHRKVRDERGTADHSSGLFS